ncbi:hypothetical protein NR800_22275 [Corallococcus interemptor]|uniref:hypothetical protein n=1 Tax=Corallococcus interemptor TaxID=2316720 RepID=UPI0035D4F929
MRARWPLGEDGWVGLEADGAHAPVALINGDDDSATVGALLDASLRGGARGTSDDNEEESSDGFTSNWPSTATVSLGLQYRLPGAD